jgi:hypothetical protein
LPPSCFARQPRGRQLVEIDIAGSVARWLGDPVNARKLAAYRGRFLPEILKKVPAEAGTPGWKRSSICSHQWNLGRRARRTFYFRRDKVVRTALDENTLTGSAIKTDG